MGSKGSKTKPNRQERERYNEAAVDFYRRAKCSWKKKDYQGALKECSRACELDPSNARFFHRAGMCSLRLEDYFEALLFFSKAVELNPEDARFFHSRGMCFYMMEEYAKAFDDFSRAITGGKMYSLYFRASCSQYLGNYETAVEDCTVFLDSIPNDHSHRASAIIMKGECLQKLNEYENAIVEFSKALEIEPNNIEAIEGRAECLLKIEEYEEAIDDFSRAIEIDPSDDVIFFGKRGECYIMLKNFHKAIVDLQKVVDKVSIDCESQYRYVILIESKYYLALCYERCGLLTSAVQEFTSLIETGDRGSYYHRAMCYVKLEEYQKAVLDFTKYLDYKPDNYYSYQWRGWCLMQLEDYENALADFNMEFEILSEDNEISQLLCVRGLCLVYLERYSEAYEDFIVASKLNPAFFGVHNKDFIELVDMVTILLDELLEGMPLEKEENESIFI